MNIKLLELLRNAFTYNIATYNTTFTYPSTSAYMAIDFDDNEIFEIPCFALAGFKSNINSLQNISSLAIQLYYTNIGTGYTSLDAALRRALNSNYDSGHLISLPHKELEPTYYGTMGAIFDINLNPILLTTWKVKFEYNNPINKNERKIRFIEPILRISPEVFINKNDSVRRYIVNNIVPTTLSLHHINSPETYRLGEVFIHTSTALNADAKIIIEDIPFKHKEISTPSVSTTNEELLQVAFDNIDDIVI